LAMLLVEWLRQIKRASVHFIGGLYRRSSEHHYFLMASGLSFSVFMCIIPLMLCVFSLLGILLAKPSVAAEIETFIDHAIPYQEYASSIKNIVFARVEEFTIYKTMAGWFGMIGLLFAASGLFSTMRTILHTAFEIKNGASVIVSKLHDLGLIFLVLAFFLISTTIIPSVGLIKSFSSRIDFLQDFHLGLVENIAVWALSFVVIWLNFFMIYVAIPHKRPSLKTLLICSLAATILWKLAEYFFGFYITHFVTFKRVYGTYSFLLVSALWIYYTSLVFIVGAEIGQLYREWRERGTESPTHLNEF